ncbi:cytochrome c maturation protein CcmE [Gilvimarinus agarilyticus]|uniref:cytochrome c maturation protein CcmE n=1 Tax=unclassified Gilvimarinus TaxID=2642066 RepID=UPI001C09C864|nr:MULTISPECIES: cytochrome c maturation protein CcmE [unclassified Gilvimarinus]MBU2887125.1 cytochrome c maturation protein CcmE [Gilvimarinus agarilyticus]MDO6571784.1 cytochrome c maturation protein CcmE [Gilvimarinus sp. 2_MG-2023]MDO6745857.1 cytochrome c maturation protein CcmE [Gilvimarinus sp. 1_MG-2023]
MHPVRKQRLIIVLAIVALSSLAIGLLVYALSENINLFYPPAKFSANEVPREVRVRAGGCVEPGSVVRDSDSLLVKFALVDGTGRLKVAYDGILPDLFAEGEAAVVNGTWSNNNVFYADQVLAKHDETYMPPEVAEAMNNGEQHQASCEEANYGS